MIKMATTKNQVLQGSIRILVPASLIRTDKTEVIIISPGWRSFQIKSDNCSERSVSCPSYTSDRNKSGCAC